MLLLRNLYQQGANATTQETLLGRSRCYNPGNSTSREPNALIREALPEGSPMLRLGKPQTIGGMPLTL